jgi:steroid Delta-isomerase
VEVHVTPADRGTWPAGASVELAAMAARHFDLIDADDMTGMAELFESDAVYRRPGYPPFVGRAEILRFYTTLRPIREGRHELEAVIVSGSRVAIRGGFIGVRHDGGPVDLRFSDFFEVGPDGWFSRRDTFFFAPPI